MKSLTRRTGAVLIAALAAIAVATVARAHDVFPTEGQTTLTPSAAAAQGFAAAGITPQIPESFPVVDGSEYSFHDIKEDGGGQLLHTGDIVLTKGSTTVTLSDPTIVIESGKTPKGELSVSVGGNRATVATLDLSKYESSEESPGFSGVKALLTAPAAAILNDAFDTTVFTEGLDLGELSTTGISQPVRFTKAGSTTAKLNRTALDLLAANDVTLTPTGPAVAKGASVNFPISGGRFEVVAFTGAIKHKGGLNFGAYKTGNYSAEYDSERGFVVRSGKQKGLPLFTIGFGEKTTFGSEDALTVGKGELRFAIEAARDLAPALGLKPKALAKVQIGTAKVFAPYVSASR